MQRSSDTLRRRGVVTALALEKHPELCSRTPLLLAGHDHEMLLEEVGKALIFDDAFEHEVWNEADSDRVVLLFDLWYPELSSAEVEGIQAMFRTVEEKRAQRE